MTVVPAVEKVERLGLTPLFERIIVLPDPEKKASATGLIIPDKAADKVNTGLVMAIGHTIVSSNVPIAVGNRIIFQKFAGTELNWKGIDYKLMMASDVVSVID